MALCFASEAMKSARLDPSGAPIRQSGRNCSGGRSVSISDCRNGRTDMAVARVSKITAASSKGFQEAVLEGMKRASKTLRGLTGFEVLSLKGKIEKGKIVEYRVTMEVTFILD
jgi:flavin-binding protein dodecin